MPNWNNKVKCLLKSEHVRRGLSNGDLASLLQANGINETKSSIDSKISRGTFSAAFFLQCLTVIGCNKIEVPDNQTNLLVDIEPQRNYKLEK